MISTKNLLICGRQFSCIVEHQFYCTNAHDVTILPRNCDPRTCERQEKDFNKTGKKKWVNLFLVELWQQEKNVIFFVCVSVCLFFFFAKIKKKISIGPCSNKHNSHERKKTGINLNNVLVIPMCDTENFSFFQQMST